MEIGDRIIAVVHVPYRQLPMRNSCIVKQIADIAGDEIDPTEFYNGAGFGGNCDLKI